MHSGHNIYSGIYKIIFTCCRIEYHFFNVQFSPCLAITVKHHLLFLVHYICQTTYANGRVYMASIPPFRTVWSITASLRVWHPLFFFFSVHFTVEKPRCMNKWRPLFIWHWCNRFYLYHSSILVQEFDILSLFHYTVCMPRQYIC